MRIAVIGSGVAGNVAAWSLNARHDVVLYEKRLRPGGHSATVEVDYDGVHVTVDTGFIVFNERNYPNFCALMDHLDVPSERSNMSFAVSCDDGALEWSGNGLGAIFAQKRNIFSPKFLKMLAEILRFNKQARLDLASGALCGKSLGGYLSTGRYARPFVDNYLAPMGAAIWSTPSAHIMDFPAESFVRFLENHRLLNVRPPEWQTITGGSKIYVEKLIEPLARKPRGLRLGQPVVRLERDADGVTVIDSSGERDRFDEVVLASHTDQTLDILGDNATADERRILGAVGYRDNDVYLHRDAALMPKRRSVWSSWNYLGSSAPEKQEQDVTVSYWMNKLQNIDHAYPLFVSLNPSVAPRPELTFGRYTYAHPQFNSAAIAAQLELPALQGQNRTWFCGAWAGYGFHEDGARSGLDVAEQLGGYIPWRATHQMVPERGRFVGLEAAE